MKMILNVFTFISILILKEIIFQLFLHFLFHAIPSGGKKNNNQCNNKLILYETHMIFRCDVCFVSCSYKITKLNKFIFHLV